MITKGLLEKIYDAASIQRWNDHARPCDLVELDKQALKMVIAYLLAKYEKSSRDISINWLSLIEGGIFEFLHRVILTDIKPHVFHKMMKKKGRELNEFVLREIAGDIKPIKGEFEKKFHHYLFDPHYAPTEKRILQAAHYLATNWEFKIIYNLNPFIYGIEKTKEEIENKVEDFYDLVGVQKVLLGKKSYGFIDLCNQLRFQKRWAGIPRIPQTSVLGHMLTVAMLAYFCSFEIDACQRRVYNNFYAGLFHDIAEVLTRDIISPIKRSVEGLKDIIKEYEKIQVEETLLPLLPLSWHDEILYLIDDEFENKIVRNGKIIKGLTHEEMARNYNSDDYSPVDGEIIRACDELAAFIEASISIEHGIKSHSLIEAMESLFTRYRDSVISGIPFGRLFREMGSDLDN